MALNNRLEYYAQIQALRKRPIITYVTSNRTNAAGVMATDSLPEILDQLLLLPEKTKEVDLLVVSNGGDPTMAWRIISLLRERVDKIGMLVPQAAFSAATLVALGADEIVMHPCGNLGPVDPQISAQKPKQGNAEREVVHFGSEDLAAFLKFVREEVGLKEQEQLKDAFELFCKESGAVPIGVATRASQLSVKMGEKLLMMHMKDGESGKKAKQIAESLNKSYFHHGYPVGRKEAKEIGLKVVEPDATLEKLMWNVWKDLEAEMQCREPFNLMHVIEQSAVANTLFAPIPQVTIPNGLTPDILNQISQQVVKNISVVNLPGVDWSTTNAIIESPRRAAVFKVFGKVFARREADLKISVNSVNLNSGWQEVCLPKG